MVMNAHDFRFSRVLLQQPLFQGMAVDDLVDIVTHMPLGFHKYAEGKTVIKAMDPCKSLLFITDGKVSICTESVDKHYRIEEEFHAPFLPEPECLFGLRQYHLRTLTAVTDCNCISIRKENVTQLLDTYAIFRINFINILSTQSQRQQRRILMPHSGSLRSRIISFMVDRCMKPAGPKLFHINMRTLAEEMGVDKRKISQVLHELCDEDKVELSRSRITVKAMENLLSE